MGDGQQPDFRTLPTGVRGWRSLVDQFAAIDDREERHYLELKSDVDLSSKDGRVKVAKFILGAANRDPAKATNYFSGHALMVLGVSKGNLIGVAGFEMKDLERIIDEGTAARSGDSLGHAA